MSRSQPAGALETFIDLVPKVDDFRKEVLDGLGRAQKTIPSKFFYDGLGSRLFERICALPEYYPTRTEVGILSANATLLGSLLPKGATVIEFGSGSSEKIRLFVRALRQPRGYVPIDISRQHLLDSAEAFARENTEVQVTAVCGDFTRPVDLDQIAPAPRVGFFPGSTIGNFTPGDSVTFLRRTAVTLGPGGLLVIGVDLKKDRSVLEAAYNDDEGVTAAFNLNLLRRINRDLGGTFRLQDFKHRAFYCPDHGRIEMHLVSLRKHEVSVGPETFAFEEGETIHTENSYKYAVSEFKELASEAGFRSVLALTDPLDRFCVHCLEVARE